MANITKRTHKDGSNVYLIRVFRGRDQYGDQLKPYTTTWTPEPGMTPKQEEKALNRFVTLYEEKCKSGMVSTERKTFAEYATYVIDLKERSNAKALTTSSYSRTLERINDVNLNGFGHIKLDEIRPDMLNNFYKALAKPGVNHKTGGGLSAQTIKGYHCFISAVFSQAVKEQLVPYNIASRATPPKTTSHEVEALEIEDVTKLIELIDHEPLMWRAMVHLLIATGARRGEILGLHWQDIDMINNKVYLRNNLIYVPKKGIENSTLKRGRSHTVSVSPAVMAILRQWKAEQARELLQIGTKSSHQGHVFTRWNGAPMYPSEASRYLTNWSKAHNLPHIYPHKLRHTQASLLINQGVDIVSVSKRLGHAKVSTTTDIYAHILKKADEAVAETITNLFYADNK